MVAPLLPRAPIDEIVVGFIFDQPIGPDAVESGVYLAQRSDRFTRHEIHEAILSAPGWVEVPGPVRVWLVSEDGEWLVQLQQDRLHTNWRRRGGSAYPGFSRGGGAMHYALSEFARCQEFCGRIREGKAPSAASVELSKIDLLVQGKHWTDMDDVAALVPMLAPALGSMLTPGPNITVSTNQPVGDANVTISVTPARMKATPTLFAFRLEFRATQPAGNDLATQLTAMNATLNQAFAQVVPDYERRFS